PPIALDHHPPRPDALPPRHVRARIHDHRLHPRVILRLPPQQQNARLRGNDHPHLIRHHHATGALEILLCQKHLDVPMQLLAHRRRQTPVIRQPLLENLAPRIRERPPPHTLPPPPSIKPGHKPPATVAPATLHPRGVLLAADATPLFATHPRHFHAPGGSDLRADRCPLSAAAQLRAQALRTFSHRPPAPRSNLPG